jgi:ABC-type lipoprotein export system ATPase subunit
VIFQFFSLLDGVSVLDNLMLPGHPPVACGGGGHAPRP